MNTRDLNINDKKGGAVDSFTTGPYFNTYLYTTLLLRSHQMNNDIYKNLKNNLEKKYLNKCYDSYGYLSKIYLIEKYECIGMPPEDPTCSAVFNVKFSCKLCRPLINTNIIATVSDINKEVINLTFGPIIILLNVNLESKINNPTINMNNFIFDEKKNLIIAKNKKSNEIKKKKSDTSTEDSKTSLGTPIRVGTNLKVTVLDVQIEKDSPKIIVLGYIEDLATDEEVAKMIEISENDKIKNTEYNTIENMDKKGRKKLLETESELYDSDDILESDETEDEDLDTDSLDSEEN